jgi:hypothetical protein
VIAVLERACAEPAESSVDSLIQGMLQVHSLNPSLHKALLEKAPLSRSSSQAFTEFGKKYQECYCSFVAMHLTGRKAASYRLVAHVLAGAIGGCALCYAPWIRPVAVCQERDYFLGLFVSEGLKICRTFLRIAYSSVSWTLALEGLPKIQALRVPAFVSTSHLFPLDIPKVPMLASLQCPKEWANG